MVRLQGIGFRYGPRRNAAEVLAGISFEVSTGGFRWLLGSSGAGKSSLLRLLSLAAMPTCGQLTLLGTEIAGVARRRLPALRRRIGTVHQDFRLLPHLSSYDNVALPLRLAGRPEGQVRADVTEMLNWVGMGRRFAARPPELSGGEQQRVAVARAVVARPELLLADEPTGSLDDGQAARVMQLLREMHRLGTTVIVATHNAALVEGNPAPILRLRGGRLIGDA